MSGQNWDKVIKGATKSKHAPPKAKYIDPLVQGTFEGEYAVADIAQSIAPRLRDSNSTVVFKALIVVHMLLRSGNIKYTYGVWSSKPHLLGLNSVTSGHDSVQNLTKYAYYLHTRLKTYASLGRDCIRDRGERRAEGRGDGGERLRGLTVEKGLLREVATLQKMMDTLLECKFYLEDKEDEVTMTALRLLVKDLLILFMSVNEGVINVLEHYFEMAQVDATTALKIYKSFCKQTEKVVTYLGVAKKMQNILNVPIPNLKHAPVSLAGSLEEYLKDPNFEQNRIEYRRNREIAEGKPVKPIESTSKSASSGKKSPAANGSSTPKQSSSSTPAARKPSADGNKAFVDFFDAIEQEQTSMFDPQTGSPNTAYFQQQAAFNPFSQQPNMLPIGQMSLSNSMPFGSLQPQMTTGAMAFGHMQPQMTGAFGQPTGGMMNAFGQMQQPQMMQPQPTGFLQPQATGPNPFRQSMMMPQMTGMNPFGQQQPQQPQQGGLSAFGQSPQRPFSSQATGSPQNAPNQNPSSLPQLQPQWTGMHAFQRPSSAPIGQQSSAANNNTNGTPQRLGSITEQNTNSQPAGAGSQHPLAPQKTGSKNPFALPPGSTPASPPKPPQPSLNEIAFSAFQNAQQQQQQQQFQQQNQQLQQGQQQAQQSQQNGSAFGSSAFGGSNSTNNVTAAPSNNSTPNNGFEDFFKAAQAKTQVPAQTGLMGSIASDFAFGRAIPSSSNDGGNNQGNGNTQNNNNNNNTSGLPFNSSNNLPSFDTGSNFVSSPSAGASGSTPSFNFSSNANTNASSNSTGASSNMFGGSAFGQSSFNQQNNQNTNNGGQQQQTQQPLQPQATRFGGSAIKPFQPSSSFGANLFAEQAKRQGSGSDMAATNGGSNNGNTFGAFSSSFGGPGQNGNSQPSRSNTFDFLNGSNNNNNPGNTGALQPQNTGGPNPFRASMLPSGGVSSNATGAFNSSAFGGSMFGGSSMNNSASTPQPQQGQSSQSQPWGSLI